MRLHFFKPDEFQGWYDKTSPELLVRLDVLRSAWGQPINISRHRSAIGREDDSQSQHNVRRWGEVRAVDTIPSGIADAMDAHKFISYAIKAGFTGIGFYSNWQQGYGVHLDVRIDAPYGKPARWGGVRGEDGKQRLTIMAEAIMEIPQVV